MVKFIAALLGAIVFSGAVQADAFSNEDAACTDTCQVHDAVRADKASPSVKEPTRTATTSRPAKRDTSAVRRVAGVQPVKS